ncbi:MAG: ATP-binding domain-containing protein, partial [Burkholderiales bacterium]|nr:ATP-binding domain-containing protein [Burkholderiales bacterium]
TGEIVSPLAAFLTHASLEAGDNQAQAGADAVQLMTVHSAKGLEFDAVFITGIEEGLFPHEQSLSDADGVEEERRLMYVAITRARRRLYLSFSQTRMLHGQTRYNVKSRFIDELPEEALKWITPKKQAFGSGYAREYEQAWNRGSGLSGIVGAGRVAAPAPPPFTPRQAPAGTGGLRAGQSVFHNKFGEGVILTLEGGGADARVQVNFGRHGTKWLLLAMAKLTPVS